MIQTKNTEIMGTFKEEVTQKIQNSSVKDIFNILNWTSVGVDSNNKGWELVKMIVENSNDFTKDIAEKWIAKYESDSLDEIDNNGDKNMTPRYPLSDKQFWCLSYQVFNNKNVYSS